jgi:hypothetical protein
MAENFSSIDVLVTAANILYAPLATALPDETTVVWNDFDAWTGWTHVGYTATPAQIGYTYDVFELSVEQSTAPIIQRKTNERATIDVALSQFDGPNLALLTDGTATITAAGASQKAFTKVVTGGATALDEYMFALEGLRPAANGSNQPVRIFFYRASIRLNGSIEFAKGAGTSLPAQITALLDSSKSAGAQLMEIHVVTAPASS